MTDALGTPRRGRAIVEPLAQGEFQTESGIVIERGEDEFVQRVRVVKLGPPPVQNGADLPWEFEEGAEVLVPYYCGRHYQWYTPEGRLRDLWLVTDAEIIHVLSARPDAGGREIA